MPRLTPSRGIALREVLVIAGFAIFFLLLLVMWLGQTRGDSHRLNCERRQQQTAAALMQYEALFDQYPGYKNLLAEDADGTRQPTGWAFALLPFLAGEAPELETTSRGEFRQMAEDPDMTRDYLSIFEQHGPEGVESLRGTKPQRRILEFICPEDPAMREGAAENASSWVVNTGLPDVKADEFPADWTANGMFENQFDAGAALPPRINAAWIADRDGLSSTLMLTENVDAGEWTAFEEPLVGFVWVANVNEDGYPTRGDGLLAINERRGEGDGTIAFARPSSFHAGGVNVVFASGKTQFLSEQIDYLVFTRLMTSDGASAQLPGSDAPVPEAYR